MRSARSAVLAWMTKGSADQITDAAGIFRAGFPRQDNRERAEASAALTADARSQTGGFAKERSLGKRGSLDHRLTQPDRAV